MRGNPSSKVRFFFFSILKFVLTLRQIRNNSSGGQEDGETLGSVFRFFLCTALNHLTFLFLSRQILHADRLTGWLPSQWSGFSTKDVVLESFSPCWFERISWLFQFTWFHSMPWEKTGKISQPNGSLSGIGRWTRCGASWKYYGDLLSDMSRR